MIAQSGYKQCLPRQKPHSLAGGHKASAVHLFKITPHSSVVVYPRDVAKVTCMCVCGSEKDQRNVKCCILCHVLLSRRHSTRLQASGLREAPGDRKRGAKPSLHPVFTQTRTPTPIDMFLSSLPEWHYQYLPSHCLLSSL